MKRFYVALTLGVITLAAQASAQHAQPAERTILDEAIVAGRGQEIQPYLLRQSADGQRVVGAVYTQFVRVARYVWKMKQHEVDVGVEDLPPALSSPLMHVMMQLPETGQSPNLARMTVITRPDTSLPAGKSVYFLPVEKRLPPPPVQMSSVERLRDIVGTLPISKASLVGAFPPELSQREVLEFCVYQPTGDGGYHVVSGFVPGPVR